ncbi:MAG: DNA-binding MarR family transcriptional regulator [Spirosomataceae bacterium]|jgi:DNA-binding MarR family transcriptional regulator
MEIDKLQVDKKQSANYQNEFHRLRVNLLYMGNWIRVEANKLLEEFELTQQQFNALRILRGQIGVERDTSFSTQDLRELLLDKMSDTSRLVDRLVKKEVIHKKPCDHDARRVHLTITEKGSALLTEIDSQMHRLDKIVNTLSESEAQQVNELLDKIK